MSELIASVERIDDFLEDLAEEVEPHLLSLQEFIFTIKDRDKPLSTQAVFGLSTAIESLRIGIFATARIEEYYSLNVLHRSLIEHFLKFNYLWMRLSSSQDDEVGVDYWVFGRKKEAADYVRNLTKAYEMVGLSVKESP